MVAHACSASLPITSPWHSWLPTISHGPEVPEPWRLTHHGSNGLDPSGQDASGEKSPPTQSGIEGDQEVVKVATPTAPTRVKVTQSAQMGCRTHRSPAPPSTAGAP